MRRLTILAVLAAVVSGRPLLAQRPLQLSLGGGVSMPQGDLKDVAEMGWHVLGALQLSSLMLPLGLRLDGAYNSFAGSDDGPGADVDLTVISVTGNLTYRWPMTNSTLSPYLIGGMGAYRADCDAATGCEGTTEFGWNAGAGTKLYLLGFKSFLEVRFHSTSRGEASVSYLPVTFGITF